MSASRAALLVARREASLLLRGRGARAFVFVLGAVAWIPVLLVPLRSGSPGIATFGEATPLLLALAGVVLPLLALLAGTDLLAGEIEDGTLVPVLTLPISRRACFAGKAMARAALLGAAYVAAFGSAGAAVTLARGSAGGADFVAVAASGLLLCLACGGIGAWLGASGAGRVRAHGAAIASWVTLAFVLDSILLAVVVATAPPPPPPVGVHGHSELPAAVDPHAHHGGEVEALAPARFPWLLLLNPVDLYRLSALAAAPGLRLRLQPGLPPGALGALALPLLAGWTLWLAAPCLLGLRRFRRAMLR